MNLMRARLTRRAVLVGSTVGLALAALGWWARSAILTAMHSQAAVSGASGAAGPQPVVPAGGAGLFDVDPDQSGVSQDPNVEVTGDIAALPLDMEF